MDKVIDFLFGLWIFDLIAENPILWAILGYGVFITVAALILIGRSEGGVLRYIGREFADIWQSRTHR